jgi:hypothetical protein
LQIKNKREDIERDLTIFFPKCTKKQPRNEFQLNNKKVFASFEKPHPTKKFPSLLGIKVKNFVNHLNSHRLIMSLTGQQGTDPSLH